MLLLMLFTTIGDQLAATARLQKDIAKPFANVAHGRVEKSVIIDISLVFRF